MLDFGRWIVEVAVNGVKSGSFDRAWAAMQLGNHYSRDRITAEDIARFDEEMKSALIYRSAVLVLVFLFFAHITSS